MSLRDYQLDHANDIEAAWTAGHRVVMATMGTGGGKTVVFCHLVKKRARPAALISHRSELVSQAALTLNREGVPHGIIGPRELVREIISMEMATHGKSFYAHGAATRVASVNTLANRKHDPWFDTVETVIVDEGHHLLAGGVYGKALAKFPNARVLAPTAHARRADGRGLGRGADGLADTLVIGPHSRALIERGFLSDYRIVAPPSDISYDRLSIGPRGDYSPVQLAATVHASKTLVGDIVGHYRKFAAGKLGLTFVVDIEEANKVCAAYNSLGIPAEIITGETSIADRAAIMRRFRARQLLQLVSVDVLGEGTDVPDVEVVSLARRTASWQLYCQQVGRALRVACAPSFGTSWDLFTDDERKAHIAASSKPYGLIIDHVGNFSWHYQQHGTPCSRQTYSLDAADRRRGPNSDAIPLRTCLNEMCFQPYPRTLPECPHCGVAAPPPAGRSTPEQVEGDLVMLDPEALAGLWREVHRVDGPARVPQSLEGPAAGACKRRHAERQAAQTPLREAMALWGGWREHLGESTSTAQKTFWYRFGMDVVTAQALGAREAGELEQRVRAHLAENGVVKRDL
jgi:superfamily II DNA or RNA helicase